MPRPVKKRIRLSREERYATILKEATQVFIEAGFDDASMAEVAHRVGVVEGNIYRYFENKRDLLIKVIENWLVHALSGYEEQLAGITGTRNRLRYMVWHHLSLIKESPELSNLFVHQLRSAPDYEATACYEMSVRYSQSTESVIREGVDSGSLRSDISIPLARDMMHGCVEYYAWSYVFRRSASLEVDTAAEQITDLVYRALSVSNEYDSTEGVLERLNRVAERLEQAT